MLCLERADKWREQLGADTVCLEGLCVCVQKVAKWREQLGADTMCVNRNTK